MSWLVWGWGGGKNKVAECVWGGGGGGSIARCVIRVFFRHVS